MVPQQPFLFERKLLPKVWGGRRLEQAMGLELPGSEAIGETWELYDRADGSSRVRGEQRTLADLLRQDAAALLGVGVAPSTEGRFPLLLKLIDAQQALSVQVHPDDEMARAEHDSGKNEAWVVLAVGENARIHRGLRPGVEPGQFRASAPTRAVEDLLWGFAPRVGDCISVPAGTVHCMGPDVVVFEVQQNSDVTYRLYDWGRPRELHVDKALVATRFDAAMPPGNERPVCAPKALPDGGELLVAMPSFRLRRYHTTTVHTLRTEGRFATITVIAGEGELCWTGPDGPQRTPIRRGDTALLPAALAAVDVQATERMEFLVCDPGVD